MTMSKPVWFDYLVWDYSDPTFPMIVGLREDTPLNIVKQYFEDQEFFRKAEEQGIRL